MHSARAEQCSKCGGSFVVDNGFKCCRECGCVAKRELDSNHTSFNQNVSKLRGVTYTRTGRFTKKIIAALVREATWRPSNHLMIYLNDLRRKNQLKTPEDLLVYISQYQTQDRRPYMYATILWTAMDNTPKILDMPRHEIDFLKEFFNEIFYVWTRLGFEKPRLPMAQAVILIVEVFKLSPAAQQTIRFVRRLKCPIRQARYRLLFQKCCIAIVNDDYRRDRFEKYDAFRSYAKNHEKLSHATRAVNEGSNVKKLEMLLGS